MLLYVPRNKAGGETRLPGVEGANVAHIEVWLSDVLPYGFGVMRDGGGGIVTNYSLFWLY